MRVTRGTDSRTSMLSWLLLGLLLLGCSDEKKMAMAPQRPTSGTSGNATPCYSPCRDHLAREDGTYSVCSAEGLLEGCIGDTSCVDGACVAATSTRAASQAGRALAYPACQADSHCPDFQVCVANRCKSSCEGDADCEMPSVCHRHVCRLPCHTESAPCLAADTVCVTGDGQSGFCMPTTPAGDQPRTPSGTFSVSRSKLDFSSVVTHGSFHLANQSPNTEMFTIRKARHTEYPDEGALVIQENPLTWLEMGELGRVAREESITVFLDPREEKEIFVSSARNTDRLLDRWDGTLVIDNSQMGTRELNLSYTSRADGQWRGSAYYFGSFRDEGLAQWEADKRAIEDVENSFVAYWDTFRRGDRDADIFFAMLASTLQESWKLPEMNAGPCEADSNACFPYDGSFLGPPGVPM